MTFFSHESENHNKDNAADSALDFHKKQQNFQNDKTEEYPSKNNKDLELARQGALQWASLEIKNKQKEKHLLSLKPPFQNPPFQNGENQNVEKKKSQEFLLPESPDKQNVIPRHSFAKNHDLNALIEKKSFSFDPEIKKNSSKKKEQENNSLCFFPDKKFQENLGNKNLKQKNIPFFALQENDMFLEETKKFHQDLFSKDNHVLFPWDSFHSQEKIISHEESFFHRIHGFFISESFHQNVSIGKKLMNTEDAHFSSPQFYHHQKELFTQQSNESNNETFQPKPSFIALWWHSLDRITLFFIFFLLFFGLWLIMAISPIIAIQHHWSTFVLLKRHSQMIGISLFFLLGGTFCGKSFATKGSWILLFASWAGSLLCIEMGQEIKGARRWLSMGGFTLQPSEFLKPSLSLVVAQLLSWERQRPSLVMFGLAFGVVIFFLFPLLLQPDLGTCILLFGVSMAQFFAAGLPWIITGILALGALGVLGILYIYFPHASHRIAAFLASAEKEDPFGGQYQIIQGLKSFTSGGWLGKGPGGGTHFHNLPDGHADFIFAVAGEEFGLLVCCFVVMLYMIISFRSLKNALEEEDSFYRLSIVGLSMCFGCQAIINLASVLRLMPTKGMTLPLMSYGGSSLMATALVLGLILGLGRRYRWIL